MHQPWMPEIGFNPGNAGGSIEREWIVTNGLGGYATGTLPNVATRRYHSYLVAAFPSPHGRYNLFSGLSERIQLSDGTVVQLSAGGLASSKDWEPDRYSHSEQFRLDFGIPIWRYRYRDIVIERRILMPQAHNTVHITYQLIEGAGPITLFLTPAFDFRPHDAEPQKGQQHRYSLVTAGEGFEIKAVESDIPPLRIYLHSAERSFDEDVGETSYWLREEDSRGYAHECSVWCAGRFNAQLSRGDKVTLVASTAPWDQILALPPETAAAAEVERREHLIASADPVLRQGCAQQVILAADQFVIAPVSRLRDLVQRHAAGEEPRSIIAGYHWFTDWGRDTMISLEGLTLTTGRESEARWILQTFALHIKNGLLPNLFPEGEQEGLYHTADATMWFFHSLDRYLAYSGDTQLLHALLPAMKDIVAWHRKGTDFGIGMDPTDCLLRQGQQGYQLTWMDAKAGDWVVTPRRGKAVEINALWYNALRLLQGWLAETGESAESAEIGALADNVSVSFNKRFWNPEREALFDVVDGELLDGGIGDDPALRPNQIFAVSLPNAVLAPSRWQAVVSSVEENLLTPYGLRTLERAHPDYKPNYHGDLLTRDAAYHQGTVWAWLLGHFLDAALRVNPGRKAQLREMLNPLLDHLSVAGIGTVSEVFDAEPPFTARGCIAQAWSVAELLRSLKKFDTSS